ncbi:hypothetical protein CEUSTIGMA_g461.t1 [Chlamydomonas eustigma]|uniref:Protein kinase domain-containing protein n=1 Tax=Chlamydomonas eustigma TaxID=1157962 RepID=A0A250WQN8_9CHLO|nr:hypothetical protein CEUSTIGMA_g461.t1 [Chlamydomonas eustigma]|eukprot:GAX73009.1 hypothetical protein CEUSTIGMA_g461.t1 [Chlamydomonas eustigma]
MQQDSTPDDETSSSGDVNVHEVTVAEENALSQLFENAMSMGSNNADIWTNIQKALDSIALSLPETHVSIHILSTSMRFVKAICNRKSPVSEIFSTAGLLHITDLPSVLKVAKSRAPMFMQVTEHCSADSLPGEYQFFYEAVKCTSFMHIPLLYGKLVLGTLLVTRVTPFTPMEQSHISGLWPFISMFVVEGGAVRLVNLEEKVQNSHSINTLAWTITSELSKLFPWCHTKDVETRMVLLNEEQPSAIVLALTALPGSLPTTSTTSTTLDSNTAEAMKEGQGLSGTLMSLTNTLTQRCVKQKSKVLFIPDLMSALKKYGEAWRDVFLDDAGVSNPNWVIAAPITLEDLTTGNPEDARPVGIVMWLSRSRVSTNMLSRTIKASISPLMHAVSQQVQRLAEMSFSVIERANITPSATSDEEEMMRIAAAMSRDPGSSSNSSKPTQHSEIEGSSEAAVSSFRGPGTSHLWDEIMSMCWVSKGGSTMGLSQSAMTSSSKYFSGDHFSQVTNSSTGGGSRPIKYSVSKSEAASTSSLMRAYQTAITLHQREGTPTPRRRLEQVEIINKAGQGAFGSVYVANWKGQVTAVKIMRHQPDGRCTMRNAWELAVTMTLRHPNVVSVHLMLTDVAVSKKGRRTVLFLPMNVDGEPSSPGAIPGQYSDVSPGQYGDVSPGPSSLGPPSPDHNSRSQVIIMEYCNLGPLNTYIADKCFHKAVILGSDEDDVELQGCISVGDRLVCVDMVIVLSLLLEVAGAMQYIHSGGFIHCDLKPENILLKALQKEGGTGFVAKVSDFGMSEMFTTGGTLLGEIGGTVTHIAPEIVTHKQVTKACDVYSFGIIMFEVYTCQRPYADILNSAGDKRSRDKMILTQVTQHQRRPAFPENALPGIYLVSKSLETGQYLLPDRNGPHHKPLPT